MNAHEAYTEPTGYWQDLTTGIPARFSATPPYRFGYPARLPCGRILVLPLRRLPDNDHAVASLIANQASNVVVAALTDHMAAQARALGAEIIAGLPTLGLAFASLVGNGSGSRAMSRSDIRASFGTMTRCPNRLLRSQAPTPVSDCGSTRTCCRSSKADGWS
jgi:hypothetical protein